MKNAGGDLVAYQLRQAAGMGGAVWGKDATNDVNDTGTGNDKNHTIYATVASADAPAGSYQDLVTVTVNY
jgi:spore coat protein U-like protein